MGNEVDLVEAFQTGDRDAFTELVSRYQNFVTSVAYSSTGDFSDSEDIAQRTFITAWQKHSELKDPAKWAGWLRGIARNLLRNDFRKKAAEKSRRQEVAAQAENKGVVATPLDRCIDEERSKLLWSILEQIPETYREPLILFYREGNSVQNVAGLMELSEDAVKQRLSRGRKLVKAEIANFVEDTLFETRPDQRLTASIMAALPAASTGFAAKAGGTALGSLFSLKALSLLVGPALGVAGAVYGSKRSLDSATSDQERSFMWKSILWVSALTGLSLVWHLVGRLYFTSFYLHPVSQAVFWGGFILILFLLIRYLNRRIVEIKQEFGTAAEKAGVSTVGAKPVSTMALRLNAVAAVVGSSAFVFICAGLNQDWLFFLIAVLMVGAFCGMGWRAAPNYTTASSQIRFNVVAIVTAILPLSLVVLLRWDVWTEKINVEPDLPGWLLALGMILFGLGLGAMLLRQANRIEQLESTKVQ